MNSLINIHNGQLMFGGRNVFLIIDKNNKSWFKGKDICDI